MPFYCAFGCKRTGVVLHVFPNPNKFPERFKVWVNLVGGELKTLSDADIYKKKRICDIHFAYEQRNRFKRLNALAVPSLHLPSTSRFHQSYTTGDVHPTDSTSVPVDLGTSRIMQQDAGDHTYPVTSAPSTSSPGTLQMQQTEVFVNAQPISLLSGESVAAVARVLVEHNYCTINRSTLRRSCRVAPVSSNSLTTRPLRRKIRCLQTEISHLRKKGLLYKERLANAQKVMENTAFQRIVENMSKPSQLFMHMQLQTKKKPKGRRFTIEEKILSLSLYKKSPKCYRLLQRYFSLPSSKSMRNLLGEIKLTDGINNILFAKIKDTMKEKGAPDRLCSLIFDEMSITPQIFYSAHKDKLEGFTSDSRAIADHVLVFMLKGVKNNFKQPIAYFFTNNLTKIQLKNMIKSVILRCLESKIIIINTVCDQSPVNVSAVTELVSETKEMFLRHGKEWRHEVMRFKGHNIVPLYDTPHLIKGLRNNLLNKDLKYITNDEEKTIKWDYFKMLYDADKSNGELRLLDKITNEHVDPDKINKMRVKLATQLFSHSVAAVTSYMVSRKDLPAECQQLVGFTILVNKLFDSLNVSSLSIPNGKVFKGPVKHKSPHHDLWKEAKSVLKTVKYVKKVKIGEKVRFVETTSVPSVINLIKTIEGIETIWEVLSRKYGLDAMLTRNFNQDPLENFFGNIRSYGARNIAPNTIAFEGAFKALLLNNFSTPHSGRANCEEDVNECLQNLDFFLREKTTDDNNNPNVSEECKIHFNNEIFFDQPHVQDSGQSNYVCGWVTKKSLEKIVRGCKNCKSALLDDTFNERNAFIKAKEYKQRWLCYPNRKTDMYFKEIQTMAVSFLKKNVPKKQLKSTIISFIGMLLVSPFECPNHKDKLEKFFINTTLNVVIYSWCRSINRILSGKIDYNGDDETKLAALHYYKKHKNYKNRK